MYTALIRVKTKEGLYILGEFEASKITSDSRTLKEMERIRKNNEFTLTIPNSVTAPSQSYFKISVLNINSIRPHFQCLSKDQYINTSDIIALSETWLTSNIPSCSLELNPEYQLCRRDYSIPNKRPQGGVANYIRNTFHFVSELRYDDIKIQYQCLLLSLRMNPRRRLIVLTMYVPPNSHNNEFFHNFDSLISPMPIDYVPTIIMW